MKPVFQRGEVPIVYSMVETARRIKPRRDGRHPFEQYYLFWTAFNNIYSTIAHSKDARTTLRIDQDGSVITRPNGNVNIPEVELVSEHEQIRLAFKEFDPDLKHALILHPGTKYFAERIPSWQGMPDRI